MSLLSSVVTGAAITAAGLFGSEPKIAKAGGHHKANVVYVAPVYSYGYAIGYPAYGGYYGGAVYSGYSQGYGVSLPAYGGYYGGAVYPSYNLGYPAYNNCCPAPVVVNPCCP